MESLDEANAKIYQELTSDDSHVRVHYLKLFSSEAEEFSNAMAHSITALHAIGNHVQDEKSQIVQTLVHTSITSHVLSMKLLLSGHTIAAGNIFRQVIEAIALALLCSNKDLDVLSRFMNDRYSSTKAVRDVLRKWNTLGLDDGAGDQLRETEAAYHEYSHITTLTMAYLIPSSGQGIYVGASFDEGKINYYREEVSRRLSLANVFVSFVAGVKKNLAEW